jgi:hypothetical protein
MEQRSGGNRGSREGRRVCVVTFLPLVSETGGGVEVVVVVVDRAEQIQSEDENMRNPKNNEGPPTNMRNDGLMTMRIGDRVCLRSIGTST